MSRRERLYRVKILSTGEEWQGPIEAYWEVEGDPISDDYTPREISASALLNVWAQWAQDRFPDGLIPIWWYASCLSAGKFIRMPFHAPRHPGKEFDDDFLESYSWPVDVENGRPLNWLSLPVADKRWTTRRPSDKGGFIQEATGWKPNILQPTVYLPSLMSVRKLEDGSWERSMYVRGLDRPSPSGSIVAPPEPGATVQ